ncbi:hypothetical protein [Lacipirellula sp.]
MSRLLLRVKAEVANALGYAHNRRPEVDELISPNDQHGGSAII